MKKKKIRAVETISEKTKRAPIEKLREVTDYTDKRLVELGLRKSKEESVIDNIRKSEGAPMLPGLREYLPTCLMINFARRGLLDFGREWQLKTKNKPYEQEKLDEFFKFVVERLKKEDTLVKKVFKQKAKEINELLDQGKSVDDKPIGDWFKPHDLRDMMNGLSVFMIDSFAVAIASKSASETSEFLEWFLSWTQQLLNYWPENLRSDGAKLFVNFITGEHEEEKESKDGVGGSI